jgi:putative ubiquitin-RnfH superfamily antitoxin RatB of RatAB toxin-antitoxin module
MLDIEVAYATPAEQPVVPLTVPAGSTLRSAVLQSGLLQRFPEIDLERCRVGVFGRLRRLDEPVEDGDRVEIYRPLLADPKEARRQRARIRGS